MPSPTVALFLAASVACLSTSPVAAVKNSYEVVYWRFYKGANCTSEVGGFTTASGQCIGESFMTKAVSSGNPSHFTPQSMQYTCGGNANGSISYGVLPNFYNEASCGGVPYVFPITDGKAELVENTCITTADGMYSYQLACGSTTPVALDSGLAVEIANGTRSITFGGGECQFGGLDTNGDLDVNETDKSFKVMCQSKTSVTIQRWTSSKNCTGAGGAVSPVTIPGDGGGGPGTGGDVPTTSDNAWPNGKFRCIEVSMASSEKNETKAEADKNEGLNTTSSGSGSSSSSGLGAGPIVGIVIAVIIVVGVLGALAYKLGKSDGQNEREEQLIQNKVGSGTADADVGGYHLYDERGL